MPCLNQNPNECPPIHNSFFSGHSRETFTPLGCGDVSQLINKYIVESPVASLAQALFESRQLALFRSLLKEVFCIMYLHPIIDSILSVPILYKPLRLGFCGAGQTHCTCHPAADA